MEGEEQEEEQAQDEVEEVVDEDEDDSNGSEMSESRGFEEALYHAIFAKLQPNIHVKRGVSKEKLMPTVKLEITQSQFDLLKQYADAQATPGTEIYLTTVAKIAPLFEHCKLFSRKTLWPILISFFHFFFSFSLSLSFCLLLSPSFFFLLASSFFFLFSSNTATLTLYASLSCH